MIFEDAVPVFMTSEERYRHRLMRFIADGRPHPRLRHHAFWLLHNVVAHPLLGLMPTRKMAELHKLSSDWLNARSAEVYDERVPEPPKMWAWRFHNIVAHIAIGLAPCAPTFRFHDVSVHWMGTPGWV